MILFNFLLLILGLNSILKIKKKYLFFMGIMLLIASLRDVSVGTDTEFYVKLYNNIRNISLINILTLSTRIEIGYLILNKIISLFFKNNFKFFILILSLIIYIPFFIILKKESKDIYFSLFLFLGLRYYYFFLSGLRQSLSIVLIFASFYFFKRNQNFKFLILNILAYFFHKTAIIFLPVFMLKEIKFEKKYINRVLFMGVIYILIGDKLLLIVTKTLKLEYYSGYITSSNFFGRFELTLVLQFFYSLVMLFFQQRIQERKQDNLINWITLLGVFMNLVSLTGSVLARLALYYNIFMIVIIPNSLVKKPNKILKIIVITFILINHFVILYFRPEWNNVASYKMFF